MVANIAVIEDEPELRALYHLALTSGGYEIAFMSGRVDQAVRAYEECTRKPVLVIMDVRLEDGSGIDAAIKILSSDASARFLFATADSDQLSPVTVSGIVGILQKPFSLKAFISAVNRAMIQQHRIQPAHESPGYA
ncbi:MAG TPA: response regulator [Methanocella sp.]|nr:response regulator [Methanocella sp.]